MRGVDATDIEPQCKLGNAEALFHLTKLWADVKNNDRSIAARKLLDERYGGSIWASR